MSDPVRLPRITIIKGSGFAFADLIPRMDGTPIQFDTDVDVWGFYVYNDRDGSLVASLTGQLPLAIGAGGTFSNTLLGPDGFSPSEQYNFRHEMPGNAWTHEGGTRYRVEYIVTMADGSGDTTLRALIDVDDRFTD